MKTKTVDTLKKSARSHREKMLVLLEKAKLGIRFRENNKSKWIFVGDIAEHIHICNLILANKVEQAGDLIFSLDTESRDSLPMPIYNIVYGEEDETAPPNSY